MAERISRGEIISLLAGIPAAVAVTGAVASAADDSSGTKAQYKYQAKPGPNRSEVQRLRALQGPGVVLARQGVRSARPATASPTPRNPTKDCHPELVEG